MIREMLPNDVPAARDLIEEFGVPCTNDEIHSRFVEISGLNTHALYVSDSESGQLAGLIQVNAEYATLLFGPRAEITLLVVGKDSRGKGIGKSLVAKAEQWAKSK